MKTTAPLPFLDEHATLIEAKVDEAWPALIETLDRAISRPLMAIYAQLVGCADGKASGPRPLAEVSTLPGFRVVTAVPGAELALHGSHRFSSYALTFRLERVGSNQARLRAESRAAFPGFAGSIYRLAIIGTGGHGVVVRHLLSTVARRAERTART